MRIIGNPLPSQHIAYLSTMHFVETDRYHRCPRLPWLTLPKLLMLPNLSSYAARKRATRRRSAR